MALTGVVFLKPRSSILTGSWQESKVEGIEAQATLRARFPARDMWRSDGILCSPGMSFSLRLFHRDDAYFETSGARAGCFGGRRRFPWDVSSTLPSQRGANRPAKGANPAIRVAMVLREDAAGGVVRERRGEGTEGHRSVERGGVGSAGAVWTGVQHGIWRWGRDPERDEPGGESREDRGGVSEEH